MIVQTVVQSPHTLDLDIERILFKERTLIIERDLLWYPFALVEAITSAGVSILEGSATGFFGAAAVLCLAPPESAEDFLIHFIPSRNSLKVIFPSPSKRIIIISTI